MLHVHDTWISFHLMTMLTSPYPSLLHPLYRHKHSLPPSRVQHTNTNTHTHSHTHTHPFSLTRTNSLTMTRAHTSYPAGDDIIQAYYKRQLAPPTKGTYRTGRTHCLYSSLSFWAYTHTHTHTRTHIHTHTYTHTHTHTHL
jgi:hypothetical protein